MFSRVYRGMPPLRSRDIFSRISYKPLLATVAGRSTPFPIYCLLAGSLINTAEVLAGFASRCFLGFRRQMLTIPYIDESPSIPLQSIAPCLDFDLAL